MYTVLLPVQTSVRSADVLQVASHLAEKDQAIRLHRIFHRVNWKMCIIRQKWSPERLQRQQRSLRPVKCAAS